MNIRQNSMLTKNALQNKTILITGGGTGLGRAMGESFLQLGANLIIVSRKLDILQNSANEMMENFGGKVLPLACDVRKYADIKSVMDEGIKEFGQIDALVNNAAGNFISPTERLSHKAFDVIVDIVLKGSYNFSLALGKYWIKNNIKGNILNIVTTYASTGSGFVVPSAISKAGVQTLTKSLASEWGKYGIRSNAIAPGMFPTKGAWTRLFPKGVGENIKLEDRIPLGRFGESNELANLAAYLMSDFSEFINGEVITIDGGESGFTAGQFNEMSKIPMEMWDAIEKQIRNK
jgi:NAD(P)-dependent dehydrogenase (short-subunit alcohol dehydrogenase family)